jgi:hypothetical protein
MADVRIAAAQREPNAVQIWGRAVDLSVICTDLHGLPSSMIAEAELRAAIPAEGHCSNQRNSKRRR